MKSRCALCGFEFEPKAREGCAACPLAGNCRLICCPNCGYKVPADSELLKKAGKILKKERHDDRIKRG